MPVLNEGRYAGEFIVSEGDGRISRETITVLSGQNLQAGAVLGKVTASGKYKALEPAAVDGSETAAGILYDAVDASAADSEGVAIVRLAEVNAAELVWPAGITGGEQTTRSASSPRSTSSPADAGLSQRTTLMPALDIFSSSAFTMVALTDAINKMPYVPGRIGQLGLFREQGVSTISVMIEEREGSLNLVETTPRAELLRSRTRPTSARPARSPCRTSRSRTPSSPTRCRTCAPSAPRTCSRACRRW
jgi:hypothetical protein